MQNIDLICIGKMNAAYFAAGVAEYQKRLGGFCSFRIVELPEVQIADKNASDKQIAKALQKEGEAILALVRAKNRHSKKQLSLGELSVLFL